VFCGSSDGTRPAYGRAAVALGAAIARRGWGLVYGGAQVGRTPRSGGAARSSG
jgi:predicted Rossmann-fold nucleotide-binding protein